jgi:hypothetical protein
MKNEKEILEVEEKAEQNLHKLSKVVLTGLKPPPGAYAFFHHSGHALARIQDCKRIVKRLFAGRIKLTELAKQLELVIPKKWPAGKPYPESTRRIMKEDRELTAYMMQDLESLYMFGVILLDQWALQAICIGNLSLAKKHPFVELVDYFDSEKKSALDPIWDQLKEKILWLHYQLRFYRNRFVVHANRPWQRGTTRSVYGDDFNLFIPTPPGWIDDDKTNQEIRKLLYLAPKYIQEADDRYWEKENPRRLIEILFNNIGKIEKKDERKQVAGIFGDVGGSTPTFQILAYNLFEFVMLATDLLFDIAQKNLSNIDLGKPFKDSAQMMGARRIISLKKQ